jgi:hypothetical protein
LAKNDGSRVSSSRCHSKNTNRISFGLFAL